MQTYDNNQENFDQTMSELPWNQPTVIDQPPQLVGQPLIPYLFPEDLDFAVPANLLLPPGYQEVVSYNGVQYLNGFMRTQIGRECEVTFLIGSDSTQIKQGKLVGVGLNYILLLSSSENEILACDFYNIKFVAFK